MDYTKSFLLHQGTPCCSKADALTFKCVHKLGGTGTIVVGTLLKITF